MSFEEFVWVLPRMVIVIVAMGSFAGIGTWIYEKFIYRPNYADELKQFNIAYVSGKNLVASIDELQKEMLKEGQ
jgi:hypothetical protein